MAEPPEALARRLEILSAAGWPAQSYESLDGWRLGYAEGVTRRANSVHPLEWNGAALGPAIEEAEQRYRARGLPPCFKISPAARPANLDKALSDRGYRAEGASVVLGAGTPAKTAPLAAGLDVHLLTAANEDWIEVAWRTTEREAQIPVLLDIVARIAPPHTFALATRDGVPVGAALAVAQDGWAGISGLNVAPQFRRSGVARGLMAALGDWAKRCRAQSIYLQVECNNKPALALYDGLGYRKAYAYHYRVAPSPQGGS